MYAFPDVILFQNKLTEMLLIQSSIFNTKQITVPVKDKAGDVLHGHLGQLVGENILEANEPQHRLLGHLLGERVADQEELDGSRRLLLLGHLVTRPPQQVLLEHCRPLYKNTQTVRYKSKILAYLLLYS